MSFKISHTGLIIKISLILKLLLIVFVDSFVPFDSMNIISFQGAWNSFVQFNPWVVEFNSSLSFQFQTKQSNSILLYADNLSLKSFIQLKLLNGKANFLFKIKSTEGIISLGLNLNDNRWHFVEIIQYDQEICFKIDDEYQSKPLQVTKSSEDWSSYAYDIFVGGLPDHCLNTLKLITLPWSCFEPHFKGQISRLIYTSKHSNQSTEQEMIDSKGIRYMDYDFCAEQNLCLHGGVCINSDNGTFCDCKSLDFEGNFCEKEKQVLEATFHGQEFIILDNNLMPITSSSREISLYFKTRQSLGLIFHISDKNGDYLNLFLKNGGVTLCIKLGTEIVEKNVKPSKIRFDDNQWHKILIHQKVEEFSITVDGVHFEKESFAGNFLFLTVSFMYIGGSDQYENLPGLKFQSNFIGCLRKIEYIADSLIFDILDLVKINNGLIKAKGKLSEDCETLKGSNPITFTTSDSFLTLPKWEASTSGSISLKIKTNEPHGLLMFNNGVSNGLGLSRDYFAIEILEGQVYLLLNLGSMPIKVKASHKRIDDSNWHVITLFKVSQTGRVGVDHTSVDFVVPGSPSSLDLKGLFYLGGLGALSNNQQFNDIPPDLWTSSLKYGFIGCVRDLVINNKMINLESYVQAQNLSEVRPACHSSALFCVKRPCLNNGICNEGWNHYTCDCSVTSFMGSVCAQDATILSFNGDQFMRIDLLQEMITQAENLNIRFRTIRSNGLILMTTSDIKPLNHLLINLELGRLKVSIDLGEGKKIFYIGHSLNDDKWHTFKFIRRGPSLELILDEEKLITQLIGQVVNFYVSSIHLGAYANHWNKVIISHQFASQVPNFAGFIQNFILNQDDMIEMSRKKLIYNFTATAKYKKKNQVTYRPFTFHSTNTYIGLPSLKVYSGLNLHFQFRTYILNGLILFNSGKMKHFIAIELVSGSLHYVFNIGDGPRRVKLNDLYTFNDNQWHSVTIRRSNLFEYTLMVDDLLTTINNTKSDLYFDLDGILYLGGVPQEMYIKLPTLVQSQNGFEGCLASLELNGQTFDLTVNDILITSKLVTPGCEANETLCYNCAFNIECNFNIDCKCNSEFPTSADCLEDQTAYKFGPKGGLIRFKFSSKQLDTKTDQLSISFMTKVENAILVRIDSDNSQDYMELQLISGSILMVYNLGTEDHNIGKLDVKVNDGNYHYVRFMRWGANSTLQLDNHNLVTKTPKGKRQLTMFNSHSLIQIGGKFNIHQTEIIRPFYGVIKNVIFNDYKLLKLAAESDVRIQINNDVELLDSFTINRQIFNETEIKNIKTLELNQESNQTDSFNETQFSGDGSGCCWNDDDDDDNDDDDDDDNDHDDDNDGDDDDNWNKENVSAINEIFLFSKPNLKYTNQSLEIGNKIDLVVSNELCKNNDCSKTSKFEEKMMFKVLLSTTTLTSSNVWSEELNLYSGHDYATATHSIFTTTIKPLLYISKSPINSILRKPIQPTPPIRTTGVPLIINIPLPNKPLIEKINSNQKPEILEANSANKTAMFITFIAIILIAIVTLAPIILFIKAKYKRTSYLQNENNKCFGNFLTNSSPVSNNLSPTHLNGNIIKVQQEKLNQNNEKKKIKEWYV